MKLHNFLVSGLQWVNLCECPRDIQLQFPKYLTALPFPQIPCINTSWVRVLQGKHRWGKSREGPSSSIHTPLTPGCHTAAASPSALLLPGCREALRESAPVEPQPAVCSAGRVASPIQQPELSGAPVPLQPEFVSAEPTTLARYEQLHSSGRCLLFFILGSLPCCV